MEMRCVRRCVLDRKLMVEKAGDCHIEARDARKSRVLPYSRTWRSDRCKLGDRHRPATNVQKNFPMPESTTTRNGLLSSANASAIAHAVIHRALPVWFWMCAAYYLCSCIKAALNYSWLQPSFDQYRVYLSLLQTPFPQNILQPDNGHHSIFPFLVILAENRWFAANQLLQSCVGVCCALITCTVPALCVLQEPGLNRVERAAGVLLCVLGVFWLANAISLLHGNEGLSV